ncbi:MAG: 50S ribosomal protein L29 [Candidatus Nanoarchaeia archaeon]
MAIVRTKELKGLAKAELKNKELELKKELMKLKAQKNTGTLANPSKIKAIKRAIAKIKTVEATK